MILPWLNDWKVFFVLFTGHHAKLGCLWDLRIIWPCAITQKCVITTMHRMNQCWCETQHFVCSRIVCFLNQQSTFFPNLWGMLPMTLFAFHSLLWVHFVHDFNAIGSWSIFSLGTCVQDISSERIRSFGHSLIEMWSFMRCRWLNHLKCVCLHFYQQFHMTNLVTSDFHLTDKQTQWSLCNCCASFFHPAQSQPDPKRAVCPWLQSHKNHSQQVLVKVHCAKKHSGEWHLQLLHWMETTVKEFCES